MPDRYGDDPDLIAAIFPDDATSEYEQTPSRQAEAITQIAAIDRCELCDEHGYRGSMVCDHIDHQAARLRGMAMIRPVLDQIAQRRKDRRP